MYRVYRDGLEDSEESVASYGAFAARIGDLLTFQGVQGLLGSC